MRGTLWFLGLFGVAVALALFASGNGSTLTVFWPPHRVDLSLNLVVVLLVLMFVLMYLALRALTALFSLPAQARTWRLAHQERVMHEALLDALSHFIVGRFIRASKAAQLVLAREASMARSGEVWADAPRLRVVAHLLVAECAQSLQDFASRETHFQQALASSALAGAKDTREAVLLRAVRWSLEQRDVGAALGWLDQLPVGVARRTLGLRLRLKAARLAGQVGVALETTRLLAKHRAFSALQAQGLLRALAVEFVQTAHDPAQLETLWNSLDVAEKSLPEVACAAAYRVLLLHGDANTALSWLLPFWQRLASQPESFILEQKIALIGALEASFSSPKYVIDATWLVRIEQAQVTHPGDAYLQYLAGVACLQLQLWGKARQLLQQALPRLGDADLQLRAWQALATMAEHQGDSEQAARAWKNAATLRLL